MVLLESNTVKFYASVCIVHYYIIWLVVNPITLP